MPTCFRLSAFQMITVLCIILKQKESLAGLPKWVHRTESCPMPNNLTAWMKASERLNCLDSLIANSIKQLQHVYHCMPSAFLNESLEFCSPVTRILNASCAVYTYFDNDLLPNYTPNSKSCSTFRKGCPLTEYFSNDIYKYEECFNFNSKHGCYYGDPNCEEYIEITMDYTKEVYFTSELQRDISTTENDIMKSNAEQSRRFNVSEGLLIFFFILCCVLVAYIILQRKKKKNRYKGKARPVTDVLKELERKEQAEEGKACPSTDEAKESERKDQAEEEAPLIRDTAINIDISPISRLLGDIASDISAEKIPMLACNLMLNIGENTEERKKISGLDCYGVLVYMDSLYDFRLNLYILMGYLEAIKEEKQLKKCMKFVKNADYPLNYYTRKRTFICWKYTEVYLKVAMDLKKCRYKHVFKITMNLVNLLGCKKEDIMIRGISEGCILLHYHVKSTLLETLRNCDFSSMRKHRVYKISILEERIFYCPELDEKFHKNEKSRIYINKLFNGLALCKSTCMMLGVSCWRGTQSRNTQKMSKETVHGEGHLGPSLELSMGKIDKELLPKLGVVNSVCVSHKDEMSIEKSESLPKVQVVQNQNSVSVSHVDEKELLAMENSERLNQKLMKYRNELRKSTTEKEKDTFISYADQDVHKQEDLADAVDRVSRIKRNIMRLELRRKRRRERDMKFSSGYSETPNPEMAYNNERKLIRTDTTVLANQILMEDKEKMPKSSENEKNSSFFFRVPLTQMMMEDKEKMPKSTENEKDNYFSYADSLLQWKPMKLTETGFDDEDEAKISKETTDISKTGLVLSGRHLKHDLSRLPSTLQNLEKRIQKIPLRIKHWNIDADPIYRSFSDYMCSTVRPVMVFDCSLYSEMHYEREPKCFRHETMDPLLDNHYISGPCMQTGGKSFQRPQDFVSRWNPILFMKTGFEEEQIKILLNLEEVQKQHRMFFGYKNKRNWTSEENQGKQFLNATFLTDKARNDVTPLRHYPCFVGQRDLHLQAAFLQNQTNSSLHALPSLSLTPQLTHFS